MDALRNAHQDPRHSKQSRHHAAPTCHMHIFFAALHVVNANKIILLNENQLTLHSTLSVPCQTHLCEQHQASNNQAMSFQILELELATVHHYHSACNRYMCRVHMETDRHGHTHRRTESETMFFFKRILKK